MLFRQLFDPESSTYTYLLADARSREAVLIDPVKTRVERDVSLLDELELLLVYAMDTHIHADHVTGTGELRERTGASIINPGHSGSSCADVYVRENDVIHFGTHALGVRETPGHTAASATYVLLDGAMAFTGDTLLIRGTGRTDFQGGDARALYHSIRDKILALPDHTLLYPAHDYQGRTVTTVNEEKRHNPRVRGKSEEEFVAILNEL
jgi:glyoxylase-like metal-dependent hydrolase (beta-lactamase superfamily II)